MANAIYDGTDAVMLSAETAAGKYPVEAVKMMAKIVLETEAARCRLERTAAARPSARALVRGRDDLRVHGARGGGPGLQRIAVFTETGTTARQLSKYRPKPPIFAL